MQTQLFEIFGLALRTSPESIHVFWIKALIFSILVPRSVLHSRQRKLPRTQLSLRGKIML